MDPYENHRSGKLLHAQLFSTIIYRLIYLGQL